MNNKIIRYILSKILYIEAGFLLLPVIVSLIYKENYSNILSFLVTIRLLHFVMSSLPQLHGL